MEPIAVDPEAERAGEPAGGPLLAPLVSHVTEPSAHPRPGRWPDRPGRRTGRYRRRRRAGRAGRPAARRPAASCRGTGGLRGLGQATGRGRGTGAPATARARPVVAGTDAPQARTRSAVATRVDRSDPAVDHGPIIGPMVAKLSLDAGERAPARRGAPRDAGDGRAGRDAPPRARSATRSIPRGRPPRRHRRQAEADPRIPTGWHACATSSATRG